MNVSVCSPCRPHRSHLPRPHCTSVYFRSLRWRLPAGRSCSRRPTPRRRRRARARVCARMRARTSRKPVVQYAHGLAGCARARAHVRVRTPAVTQLPRSYMRSCEPSACSIAHAYTCSHTSARASLRAGAAARHCGRLFIQPRGRSIVGAHVRRRTTIARERRTCAGLHGNGRARGK